MYFKILSRGLVAVVGLCALSSTASDAWAQSSGLFGASGATSGSNGMGTASVGQTMQSTAFPSTGFPAPGASLTGAPGLGGQTGLGGQAGMGMTGQQSGLIGLANGTNLIGTGAPAGQTMTGQPGQMMNRQGQQNRNNANRRTGQNRNQTNQPGGAGAGNQQKTTVRPQMVVAFDHPRPDAESMQSSITTRFDKLASKSQFKDIEVETVGSMVILRGAVDSERSSRLAAILARMEPGVSKVRNELTVKEPLPPTPSPED